MPKIMIIKYQQFAKTNTFSLSFHILFSPFLHIFPQDTSKSGFGDGQKWGWTPHFGGGVQPHFYPWKNVCFPIFSHGEKWRKKYMEREGNEYFSLSFHILF